MQWWISDPTGSEGIWLDRIFVRERGRVTHREENL